MATAAARVALLATWRERLRRAFAASRRAWPGPAPLAAAVAGAALTGAGVAWYKGRVNFAAPQGSLTVFAQKHVDSNDMVEKLSLRKQRFMQFSSLEHEGEHYMTPRDFLFSVMFDQMERKTLVKKLTKKDIEDILAGFQKARCGPSFFRDLGDKGLISYTEYLFLLTILTKPHTGFHVAFKMLDSDGDEMVEKKEFFKVPPFVDLNMNNNEGIHTKRGEGCGFGYQKAEMIEKSKTFKNISKGIPESRHSHTEHRASFI